MKTKASDYFAMIPEWVLYGDISPAAVRVFGCLHRFANGQTAKCHPSRQTIAKLCRISVKSVDRALDELIGLGAVTCVKRWIDAEGEITEDPAQGVEFTSNEYTVIMTLPRVNLTPPLGKSDATGRDKNDTQTKASNNQSQEPKSSSSVDEGFTEFWNLYPRKVGKDAAIIAYRRALKKAKHQDILAGLHLYLLTCPKEKHFIAHPTTWLNQGRWADETDQPKPDPTPTQPAWQPCGNCRNGWIETPDNALAPCPCTHRP